MFWIRRSASPLPAVLISLIVGVVGSTAIAMLASRVQRGMQNRVIMGGVIVLIVAATLPGAVTRIDLSRLSQFDLIFIEHHFSITLGQADRLAAGHRLG